MEFTYYTFDAATGNLLDDDGFVAFGMKFESAEQADEYFRENDIVGVIR